MIRGHSVIKIYFKRAVFSYIFLILFISSNTNAAMFARLIAEETAPRARIIRAALGKGWSCPKQFHRDRPLVQEVAYKCFQVDFYRPAQHVSILYDCAVRTILLGALNQDGDEEALKQLAKDRSWMEWMWDDGASQSYAESYGISNNEVKNIQTYLHGLWPVVAVIDPKYRAPLHRALTIGSIKDYPLEDDALIAYLQRQGHLEYPKDPQLAAFIKNLGAKDHLLKYLRDDSPNDQRAFSH